MSKKLGIKLKWLLVYSLGFLIAYSVFNVLILSYLVFDSSHSITIFEPRVEIAFFEFVMCLGTICLGVYCIYRLGEY